MTEVIISGFDPLKFTIPKVDKFVGEVAIVLPNVHVQLHDLSMGIDLLKGAHIGADGPVFSVTMTIPEPGVTPAQMMEFLYAAQDTLEDIWKTGQAELDKRGALLRRIM